MAKKDLVELIRQHPDAVFVIDNDCWWMRKPPSKPLAEMTSAEFDEYDETSVLARSGEVVKRGDGGYGCGDAYGGDILQALAEIVGVKVESV